MHPARYAPRRTVGAAPSERPAWLRPYVLVEGKLSAAPLDLPQRFQGVLERLAAAGWRVAVQSIGTDFGAVPTPRDQPLAVYLWRAGGFTPQNAQLALGAALEAASLRYSPWRAWAGEVTREVIQPNIKDSRAFGGAFLRALCAVAVVLVLATGHED